MTTTKQEREALERKLNQAHGEALSELEAAKNALELAQLHAVGAGIPVPGKLVDDLDRCRRRASECEGALVAFARVRDETAIADRQRARDAREQAVTEGLARVEAAGQALIAQLVQLMSDGAFADLAHSIEALRVPLRGAGISVLAADGWHTSEAMRGLLTQPADSIGFQMLRSIAVDNSGSYGRQRAAETLEAFCTELAAHTKRQPDAWPAA